MANRRRPRLLALVVSTIFGALYATDAHAAEELVVARSSDAADCPDTRSLAQMVRALTPRAPQAGDGNAAADRIEVDFTRDGATLRATIRFVGERSGTRSLDHLGGACGSLADATALTIAVLVDPDFVPPPEKAPAAPSPEEPSNAKLRIAVDGSIGAAIGVVRTVAPSFGLDAELGIGWASVGLGGFVVPPQDLALDRGNVTVSLIAGGPSGCVWPVASRAIQLGACGAFYFGALGAEASGFSTNSSSTRTWVAAGAHAQARVRIAGAFGWFLRAGAIVPFHQHSFGVERAGVAYEVPAVGLVTATGPTLMFP